MTLDWWFSREKPLFPVLYYRVSVRLLSAGGDAFLYTIRSPLPAGSISIRSRLSPPRKTSFYSSHDNVSLQFTEDCRKFSLDSIVALSEEVVFTQYVIR